ncbi:MAG TPA: TIGR04222 domain-containing membrane protein [Candidatus Sulfotelmatobacter sp.]|nr:TIGR04222 domain-containing membrane protein [Candidatus Sulfotelmatobacter sp.]
MNPFDLRGPEFLLFYVMLTAAVIVLTAWLRDMMERGPTPQVRLDDPYFVAFVRGGINEAFRTAIIVLLDRGWLQAEGSLVHRRGDVESRPEQPAIEQEVLSFFHTPRAAYDALKNCSLGSAASGYEKQATELDLIPDRWRNGMRHVLVAAAACGLVLVSLIKIAIAISRGRSNILFLIILTILGPYLLSRLLLHGPTVKGRVLIRNVQALFSDLKGRRPFLRPGAGTKEIAWLVGVFGAGALPQSGFPDVKALFPLSSSPANLGGTTSSCGTVSSCGSGGGGCGGGCGGGGCGGGCGGCGS